MPIYIIGSIAHSVAWGDDGPINADGPLFFSFASPPPVRPPVRRSSLRFVVLHLPVRAFYILGRSQTSNQRTNDRSPPPLARTASFPFLLVRVRGHRIVLFRPRWNEAGLLAFRKYVLYLTGKGSFWLYWFILHGCST
jgi:hypothetical protein